LVIWTALLMAGIPAAPPVARDAAQRSQSQAVAVRLTGETAQHREKQAAQREGAS